MKRSQAKDLLYLGGIQDQYINQVAVDFMYEARVLEVERGRLLGPTPDAYSEYDLWCISWLADARNTLLRTTEDLYDPDICFDIAINVGPFDDFQQKAAAFEASHGEPPLNDDDAKFIASTGFQNMGRAFDRGMSVAIVLALIVAVGGCFLFLGGLLPAIILSVLVCVVLLVPYVLYYPYAMKNAYVRGLILPTLRNPPAEGFVVCVDSKETKAALKSRGFYDPGLWHLLPMAGGDFWVGAFVGAIALLLSITLLGGGFQMGSIVAIIIIVISILLVRSDSSKERLDDAVGLREELRKKSATGGSNHA